MLGAGMALWRWGGQYVCCLVITNILYSQNYISMLDLYQILLPVYVALIIITLVYLKLAIRDNVLTQEILDKNVSTLNATSHDQQTSHTKRCAKYMLKNFTLLEPCTVGRGKYKLCLLLSLSVVSLATFYSNSPFAFVFVGTTTYCTYFVLAKALVVAPSGSEGEQGEVTREKYLHVLFALASIVINFVLIGLLFKNYKNIELNLFIVDCMINLAIDNFAVRPLAVVLLSLPLSRSEAVMQYIASEERHVALIEFSLKLDGKELLQKPIGKMYSPSKIPKCVPLNMEIEPIPFHQQPIMDKSQRLEKSLSALKVFANEENLERSMSILNQISQVESIEKSMEILKRITQEQNLEKSLLILAAMAREEKQEKSAYFLKKIKKERSAPVQATPMKKNNGYDECSLNSLFSSTNKDPHSPRGNDHAELAESHRISEKVVDLNEDLPFQYKERKFGSENVIMINPSRQEPTENEEDYTNEELAKRKITQESLEEENFNFSKKQTINLEDQLPNPLKISIHESSGPSSRNQPLRICVNGEERPCTNEDEDEEIESDRFRKRRESINPDEITTKNTIGVLEVKLSNNQCEQIEQIDLNSPERRRKMAFKEEELSRLDIIKKKKKKLSCDERNRVIRFTTGEPYLEYLPNMLNKEGKKKKSQALSKKELIIDSRMANSTKKQKKKEINFENNENIVPSFRIEEV